MLDISEVPVIDSNVTICKYSALGGVKYIKLSDNVSRSVLYIPELRFNKYFNTFKDVLNNQEKYSKIFIMSRGHNWFRFVDIDRSLLGTDYFMVDRVPIYVEMFKHISKYKVCLDRDSLLSQNLCVLEAVNKKIKNCKKLNKIDGLLYLKL